MSLPALRHGLVPAALTMAADHDKYLGIYFNDHLGGSTAGLELAKQRGDEAPSTSTTTTQSKDA